MNSRSINHFFISNKYKLPFRFFFCTFLCFIVCAFIVISSYAQILQPRRYERKQKGSDDYFTIIPLKDEGLCLLRHKDKFNGGKRVWEFLLLDTALQEVKTVEFEEENRNNLVGYEYVPGYLYFLYRAGETSRNNLQLIEFKTNGELSGRFEINPELDFKLTHFIKAGSKMILGGYVSKEPVILIYEMATNLIKVVPGFFQKDNELVDLRANQNKTFNTILIDRSNRQEKKFIFRTFDENGELLLEDVVPIEEKKSLQTSISSTLERDEILVAGSWGDRQAKQSVGFYSLPIDPFHEQKINYFTFGELTHYLDYMKPARARRIRESSEKDISEGRNPDFYNYIMPYKVEENKEGFLMLAEVYTPVSTSNQFIGPYGSPYGYGMPYGNPYIYNPYYGNYFVNRMYNPYSYGNNVRNSDQIKTTQSVLIAFDPNGKLLWDQSMKMENIESASLGQVSDFNYSKGEIVFIYKSKDAELKIKVIDPVGGDVQEVTEKIKLTDPNDQFRSEKEQEGGLRKWYDNTFYIWGYQTIRNLSMEDRVRDVFYINKVVVR